MKKLLLFVSLFICCNGNAQQLKIDTLKNITAGFNSFTSLPIYGVTRSGGVYGAGITLMYDDNGKGLPVQLARVDFQKKKVTYKTLPTIISGNGALWMSVYDQLGNAYISLKAPVFRVLKINMKDSIQYEDLGSPFLGNGSWAYSISPGRDGKMYFGSSGDSIKWSSYDPSTGAWEKHPVIDDKNDYVISIAGDSDYVYVQTGQLNSVQLWSIRKKDNAKKFLGKVPNTTRINLLIKRDGVFAYFNTDTLRGWYQLKKVIKQAYKKDNRNLM